MTHKTKRLYLFIVLAIGFSSSIGQASNQFLIPALKFPGRTPSTRVTMEHVPLFSPLDIKIKRGDKIIAYYGTSHRGPIDQNYKFEIIARKGKHRAVLISKKLPDNAGWRCFESPIPKKFYGQMTLEFQVHRFNHDSNRYEKSEEGAAGWGGLRVGRFERKRGEKNLVIVSLDTCRTKSLSKNGNTRPTSPFLDQLAKSSVDFLQASSPSSWTLPAHMSLFTGRYPSWHTMTYNRDSHFHELPLEIPLLTNHLREKGYLGVAFTGGAKLASSFGYYRGFDWYQENLNTDADAVINFSDAITWIKKNRKKKFYLFLHTYEIHTPYTHPIFLENNYSKGESALALYEGDINFTDAWLTRFMKIMDELDLSKKTVFIITSDHGEEFEERGLGLYYQHGHTLKDELIKIPLLIYAPNFLRPQKADKYQISLVDVMPTVFDLIGAPLDATTQNSIAGKNLSQYVLNGNWPDESYAFSEITTYAPARYSVRYSTGNAMYKFTVSPDTVFPAYTESIRKNIFGELSVAEDIHQFAEKEETRSYFDLIADPHEKNPLSLNTRFPRQRLEELMHKYLGGFQDLRGIVTQSTLTDEEVKKNLKTLGY